MQKFISDGGLLFITEYEDNLHIIRLNKTIWVNLPKGRGTKLKGLVSGSQLQEFFGQTHTKVCFFV